MVEGDNVSLQKKIDYFFEVCGPNINAWDPSGIRINCTSSWCGSVDKGAESERRLAVFNEVIKEFGVGRDDSNPFLFVRLFRALIPMTFSTPCIEVHWLRIKRVDCRWDYAYWKGLLPLRFFGGGAFVTDVSLIPPPSMLQVALNWSAGILIKKFWNTHLIFMSMPCFHGSIGHSSLMRAWKSRSYAGGWYKYTELVKRFFTS